MENTSSNRIEWADNLKALAIFLVVLGHTGLEGQSASYNILREWIYLFHMPLFFLLSGLSFSVVFRQGKKAVLKQIGNLIIIYCLQSAFYGIFNMAVHHFLNIQTQVNAALKDIFAIFLYPLGHFWYLHVLILIYIVEWVLNSFIKDDRIKLAIVLILACIGKNTHVDTLSAVMHYILYFECGRQILLVKKIPMAVSLIGVILSFIFPFISIDADFLVRIIEVFIALSLSTFLVNLFSKFLNKKIDIVTSMGKNCIWIYVFHTYFTSAFRNICNMVIPSLPEISVILVTLIGLIGPMAVMYFFKKVRLDKLVVKPIAYFWK